MTTAAYVAELVTELAAMAQRDGLATLSRLLDMVRLEAEFILKQEKSKE